MLQSLLAQKDSSVQIFGRVPRNHLTEVWLIHGFHHFADVLPKTPVTRMTDIKVPAERSAVQEETGFKSKYNI
jgi:hypothetical protein